MLAVMVSATIESVMELAGRLSVPLTIKLETLRLLIVELVIVVVANVVVAEKVLRPVKVWLLARYAKEVVPVNWFTERPVMVALVKLSEELTVSAPMVLVLDMMPPQALSRPVSEPPASNR